MSKLWREVVREVHGEFRGVKLEEILVDNCALQLVRRPRQFDVILAPNLFGDILSDLAAALPGSLGLSPSASFNSKGFALYEPSGGSAPDIAGKGVCNPIAQILCAAMMLRHSFNWEEEAKAVEGAVRAAISDGFRTADISNRGDSGEKVVGTTQMGAEILRRLVA
jgi:3-isopropylmalate dehydrogenase